MEVRESPEHSPMGRCCSGTWEVPVIFELLEKWGGVPHREMFNIFNMGVGMVLVVDPSEAQQAIDILASHGEKAFVDHWRFCHNG